MKTIEKAYLAGMEAKAKDLTLNNNPYLYELYWTAWVDGFNGNPIGTRLPERREYL